MPAKRDEEFSVRNQVRVHAQLQKAFGTGATDKGTSAGLTKALYLATLKPLVTPLIDRYVILISALTWNKLCYNMLQDVNKM